MPVTKKTVSSSSDIDEWIKSDFNSFLFSRFFSPRYRFAVVGFLREKHFIYDICYENQFLLILSFNIPLCFHINYYAYKQSTQLSVWRCIQKSQDNAHNTQVARSSRVSRWGVLQWCLVSECAEWRGWMWKGLIVARVFMCVLHQLSAIFWYRQCGGSWRTTGVQVLCEIG